MNTKQVLIDFLIPIPQKKIIAICQDIILIICFSSLTAICAKIKVEIGPVPITLQTFAVLSSGILLGSKKGALSQIFYLISGLAGIPLFARGGGIQYLLSPTFGYIIGFIFAAFFVGKLAEKGWDRSFKSSILAMIFGNIFIYIVGLIWLTGFFSPEKVLKVGLYPFLLGDIIKIIFASLLFPFAWKIIKKFKGHHSVAKTLA